MIKEKKLPVLVIMDGWGAAGKGSVLGRVIKNLDPRFFKCETLTAAYQMRRKKTFPVQIFHKDTGSGQVLFL